MVFLATVDPSPRPQPMKFPVFGRGPTPIIAPLNETALVAIGQKRPCYRRIV